MLQRILTPAIMAVAVFLAAGCGLFKKSEPPPPPPVTVSAAQSGTSVELAPAQAVVVRLPSNPTTGYRWVYVEPKDAVLRVDGPSTYEPSQSAGAAAGAGGTEVWKLAALKAGQQQLRFEYRRPWEQDVPPAQVATYPVTVKAPPAK